MLRKLAVSPGVKRLFSLQHVRYGSQKASSITVDNPYTGEIHCEVPISTTDEAKQIIGKCDTAQKEFWGFTRSALVERQEVCNNFLNAIQEMQHEICEDITHSMGKPYPQAKNEVSGLMERAIAMIDVATQVLYDENLPPIPGFERTIVRQPIGNVFVIAPWNYPLMCAINSVIPAILCGNSVILKLSSRTPRVADFFARAFAKTNAPPNLLSALHCTHETTAEVINDARIGSVVFTGSVGGGYQIQSATSNRLINTTLELGGKDAAYIAPDANIDIAAEGIVDGAMYNAGQSCCAIERAYIDDSIYDAVIDKCASIIDGYRLGDPMDNDTTMGPLANASAPLFLEKQVTDAIQKGARLVSGTGKGCTDSNGKGRFFSPTLLADCTHEMEIMKEESFGPVLPVCKVSSDAEAIQMINDSEFGLTAAIYTANIERARRMSREIETGTVFMNRCDYLDPLLAWTGVKDTGKGVSLSRHCFDSFSRFKSLHFKKL